MEEKYIMLDLDDDKSKDVAEALSNDTCKKILKLLADKEASETEIARELNIPVNTAEYNIKKLEKAGMIETQKHFWSVKGKKMPSYRLSRKYIVIAPKKSNWEKFKPILPIAIVSIIFAFIIQIYFESRETALSAVQRVNDSLQEKAISAASDVAANLPAATSISSGILNYYTWYLLGVLTAILVLMIWLWKKN
jgi:DNA-binding transcriptional ArsR family regulator